MQVVTDSGVQLDLRGQSSLGSGVSGSVFGHPLDGTLCLKIYHPGDAASNATKVRAMLARVPEGVSDRAGRPQAAWPVEAVHASGRPVGFVMPKVDIKSSRSLTALCNQAETDEVSRKQLLVAAINICSLVANMHRAGHFLIDFNPANFRFLGDSGFLTLIDCDGFQIANPPAAGIDAPAAWLDHLAPRFIDVDGSPKLQEANADGAYQDSWGCSLLVFRLLNRSILPFDGIPKRGMAGLVPSENADRIRACARLYPYGQTPSSILEPLPLSLHDSLPAPMRDAFDRCFAREDPLDAVEWRNLLGDLLAKGQACRKDARHFALSSPCEQCASRLPTGAQPSPPSAAVPFGGRGPPVGGVAPPVGPAPPADFRVWIWLVGLAFAGLILLLLGSPGGPVGQPGASAAPERQWTGGVVWQGSEAAQEAIRGCEDRSCLSQILARYGAPRETVDFIQAQGRALSDQDPAYPIAFNGTGRVRAVELFYPNLGQGGETRYVFVNGRSRMQFVDSNIEQATRESRQYQAFKAQYPDASWWNAPSFVDEQVAADGSQRFRFRLVLLNGCRACAILGDLDLGYNFDASGRYTGVSVVGVQSAPTAEYGFLIDQLAQGSQNFADVTLARRDNTTIIAAAQTIISEKSRCRLSVNTNPTNMVEGWFLTDDLFNIGDVEIRTNRTQSGNMSISCRDGSACIAREYSDRPDRPRFFASNFNVPPGNVDVVMSLFRQVQSICAR